MDPLAHTLFGAALAESGLKRRSRYATATLMIGANLPDIDALANLLGDDASLHYRRGWTHGILAMIVLPLLLAVGVWLWHRWRGATRAPPPGTPAFRPRAVFALAVLGVFSHPMLDWLNTYGVRLLMPFDGRWFYGDTLFIIEPWMWLLLVGGLVVAHSGTRRAATAWAMLALAATALVLGSAVASSAVKLVWCLGVATITALAWRKPAWAPGGRLTQAALAALLIYVGASYSLARMAESRVAQRFSASQVQSNPVPGNPLRHRLVIVADDLYRILAADGETHELTRDMPDAVVRRAMEAESVRGFMTWTRFPHWTVEEQPDSWLVRFQDLRYQGPDLASVRGIGAAQVTVPKSEVDAPASTLR